MPLRFDPPTAEHLRRAIAEAGGVEVFAIGDVDRGTVVGITVTCRGTVDSVPALLDRPRAGQVVIHNHPSGNIGPSQPDLALASMYGEDGVGVVIVDNDVQRDNWVVEPFVQRVAPVSDDALWRFFHEGLPQALDGWEARPQQLDMARRVAACLQEDRPLLCEAGTGTGKSLAYLVPAALWALANDTKVVVSTFTKALQGQLLTADLPLLAAGGIEVRTAVLQGRNNYLCKRRLELVRAEGNLLGDDGDAQIEALADWSKHTRDGSRSDLGFPVEPELWDRVLSDGDLTLSVRCPHYSECHYYRARRQASAAHVIVVNHALLLTDLALREEVGRGFLPRYDRVVIDEAHHLEDAATGVATERLSWVGIRRALFGLRDTKRRAGALTRLVRLHSDPTGELSALASEADQRVEQLMGESQDALVHVGETLLAKEPAVRITAAVEQTEAWRLDVVPTVRHLADGLRRTVEILEHIDQALPDGPIPEDKAQPVLDIRRARRRLVAHQGIANTFLDDQAQRCRWTEPGRRTRGRSSEPSHAALCSAPIDTAPVLRRILWRVIGGVAGTSATLTVNGSFAYLKRRVGLDTSEQVDEAIFDSPFDHAAQAVLGLPRDLPPPDDARYLGATTEVITDAVALSDGGAFVLCTSHAAVKHYAAALRSEGGRAVLAQGTLGRGVLLERFRNDPRAVLVGTDSFWEGVSVRGDGLRLVVIPRMPFRVPTEPLLEARHERLVALGRDPFHEVALPEAILKLRQGYGRLIRSRADRGVVLLLDRRLHDRRYGLRVLRSLPPARRVKGPWRLVRQDVQRTLAKVVRDETMR
ncbi:MAG: hypothetical protein KTR31_00895 [Myxococcales bacterium]|nr:hypothetical protein [Myxococcales bacterium]